MILGAFRPFIRDGESLEYKRGRVDVAVHACGSRSTTSSRSGSP